MADQEKRLTIFGRLDDSQVSNEIGVVEVSGKVEPITDENRQPTDAPDATTRISFDLPAALRKLADEMDGGVEDGRQAVTVVFEPGSIVVVGSTPDPLEIAQQIVEGMRTP